MCVRVDDAWHDGTTIGINGSGVSGNNNVRRCANADDVLPFDNNNALLDGLLCRPVNDLSIPYHHRIAS
jgi:hypothetical protein